MPYYDYLCEGCQHTFMEQHRMAENHHPVDKPCPKCGERKVRIALTPNIMVDSVRLLGMSKKLDGSWKETLARIHENTPGSRLKENSSVQF